MALSGPYSIKTRVPMPRFTFVFLLYSACTTFFTPIQGGRIVKAKYGDDFRKWDLRELFIFGPYNYRELLDSVRQRYKIPWNDNINLKYRDADGDWVNMDDGGETCQTQDLYVEVFTSQGATTIAPAAPPPPPPAPPAEEVAPAEPAPAE